MLFLTVNFIRDISIYIDSKLLFLRIVTFFVLSIHGYILYPINENDYFFGDCFASLFGENL